MHGHGASRRGERCALEPRIELRLGELVHVLEQRAGRIERLQGGERSPRQLHALVETALLAGDAGQERRLLHGGVGLELRVGRVGDAVGNVGAGPVQAAEHDLGIGEPPRVPGDRLPRPGARVELVPLARHAQGAGSEPELRVADGEVDRHHRLPLDVPAGLEGGERLRGIAKGLAQVALVEVQHVEGVADAERVTGRLAQGERLVGRGVGILGTSLMAAGHRHDPHRASGPRRVAQLRRSACAPRARARCRIRPVRPGATRPPPAAAARAPPASAAPCAWHPSRPPSRRGRPPRSRRRGCARRRAGTARGRRPPSRAPASRDRPSRRRLRLQRRGCPARCGFRRAGPAGSGVRRPGPPGSARAARGEVDGARVLSCGRCVDDRGHRCLRDRRRFARTRGTRRPTPLRRCPGSLCDGHRARLLHPASSVPRPGQGEACLRGPKARLGLWQAP